MDWITAIEREGHALSIAARHDFAAAVPACPGWDVHELVRHTGHSHHWAEAIVRERLDAPPSLEELTVPHGNELGWYEAGLEAMLATFRAADPSAAVWTFGPVKTPLFWFRRQLHETTVHRVDAEQATGQVTPIDPAVAVDGVAEALEVFLPMLARRRSEAGGTVHLHATDVHGEWLLSFGDGEVAVEEGHAKGDAAVRGPAADLYLWLWGRQDLDALEVFGDAALATKLRQVIAA